MRLRDSKIAMSVVVFSLVGWPILIMLRGDLPSTITKPLAGALVACLVLLPLIGYFVHHAPTSDATREKIRKYRRLGQVFALGASALIVVAVLVGYNLP